MPTSLFLFGTDHRLQCGGADSTNEQHEAFAQEIRAVCRLYKIRRVAEEMTADGRRRYGVESTLASRVATEMSIVHHEVDLSAQERQALSISDNTLFNAGDYLLPRDGGVKLRGALDALSNEVRERIWAHRILDKNPWPVLFVLGADHVKSFRRIWHRLGTEAAVVYEDYAA